MVTVAVYWVLAVSAAVGVKMAVLLDESYVTAPGTAVPPAVAAKVNVPTAVIVEAVIGALKVAATFWLSGTLVAPLTGMVEVTAGGPVVNVQT